MAVPRRSTGRTDNVPASRAEQKAASRQAILRAALNCLNLHGFQKTSIDLIAREAGVSKGLVLYHFQSKEQIFVELQGLLFKRLAERIENATAGLAHSAERTVWAAEELWEALHRMQHMLPAGLTLLESGLRQERLRNRASAFFEEQRKLIIAGVRAVSGQRPEELGISAEGLADLTSAVVIGLLVLQSFSDHPERGRASYETFVNLIVRSLFPPDTKEAQT